MLIDGSVAETIANSKKEALDFVCKHFQYDDEEEFFNDINYIEWVESGYRYFQNLVTNTLESNTTLNYFLPTLKFSPTKKPTRQLQVEYESDYYEQ